MSSKDKVVKSRAISQSELKLKEKFTEAIAEQSKLMDEIGKLLITIELATPAIYATILKLIKGDSAKLTLEPLTFCSFFLWFMALIVTFYAIFPKKYSVDKSNFTEIENFFTKAAKDKAIALLISATIFSAGIFVSLYTIFKG